MRILGDRVALNPVVQTASPVAAKRDELSDTGVMRILGDFTPVLGTMTAAPLPQLRACPVCSIGVPETASVCKYCQCYIGASQSSRDQ